MTTNSFISTGPDLDWATDANWSLGHKPTAGEDAVIPVGKSCVVSAADGTCLSVLVQSTARLAYQNSRVLTVIGDATYAALSNGIGTTTIGRLVVGGTFNYYALVANPVTKWEIDLAGAGYFHNTTMAHIDASFGNDADATDNCVDAGFNTSVVFYVPQITSLTSGGPIVGGVQIDIYGTDLDVVNAVLVGGSPATSVAVVSSGHVTCISPAHAAGFVDVRVTDADGGTDLAVGAYEYQDPAAVGGGGGSSTFARRLGLGL